MATIIVGYRRLYTSPLCSCKESADIPVSAELGDDQVWVYFGQKPRFGITHSTGPKYLTNKKSDWEMKHTPNPSEVGMEGAFFTEIACFRRVEVEAKLKTAFEARERAAVNEVLDLPQKCLPDLQNLVETAAGVVGLRLHPELMLEFVCDNHLALYDNSDFAYTFTGTEIRLLEGVRLKDKAGGHLVASFQKLSSGSPGKLQMARRSLPWLARSWNHRDQADDFMSLFIPMEIICSGAGEVPSSAEREKALVELVREHGTEDQVSYVKSLLSRNAPSLASRFASLAREAQLPGWEKDVDAFRKFNRTRNAILHQGENRPKHEVSVSHEEVRLLGDIAEKYICWILFDDTILYHSRFRKTKADGSPTEP